MSILCHCDTRRCHKIILSQLKIESMYRNLNHLFNFEALKIVNFAVYLDTKVALLQDCESPNLIF